MVWEQESKAIVMLNRLIENGAVKCSRYYPEGEIGDTETFGDFTVSLLDVKDHGNFILRNLRVFNAAGTARDVLHFHYIMWPDFGVPQSPSAFLDFLLAVRLSGSLDASIGPAVVHCSAGIGRTGTFCLVDSCLMNIARTRDPNCTNVIDMLLALRSYRMGLIQTADQLRFSYLAVIEGSHRLLSPNDSFAAILQNNNEVILHRETPTDATTTATTTTDESTYPSSTYPSSTYPDTSTEYTTTPTSIDPLTPITELDTDSTMVNNTQTNSTDSSVDPSQFNPLIHDENKEIRRRVRDERNKKTMDQIRRMQEHQLECTWYHERWWRRYINYQSVTVGVSLSVAAISGLLYYMTNRTT